MNATTAIRKHISNLGVDDLFNNKDFLAYARRTTVDVVLHRLCKRGEIVREAPGVYRKAASESTPSLTQIAVFKAKAFGRLITDEFANVAAKIFQWGCATEQPTFAIDGPSSSFKTTSGIRIFFRRRCARKAALGNGLVAKLIKALWYIGRPDPGALRHVSSSYLAGPEKLEFLATAGLMPGWLADSLKTNPI